MFANSDSQTFLWILLASGGFFLATMMFGGGDGDSASDPGADGHGAISWDVFSLRNLALFGVGFGAVGFLSTQMGYGMFTSVCGGITSGVAMVALGIWFFRLISQQESNTMTDPDALVGRGANVTTTIPANGFGEIMTVNEHGTQVSLYAQSEGGAVEKGRSVVILSVAGKNAIVQAE
jgi:hypothetical protein